MHFSEMKIDKFLLYLIFFGVFPKAPVSCGRLWSSCEGNCSCRSRSPQACYLHAEDFAAKAELRNSRRRTRTILFSCPVRRCSKRTGYTKNCQTLFCPPNRPNSKKYPQKTTCDRIQFFWQQGKTGRLLQSPSPEGRRRWQKPGWCANLRNSKRTYELPGYGRNP